MNRNDDDAALRSRLSPEAYRVTRENGTEPPFENPYWNVFERGIYLDVISGELLFSSEDKFDAGCGWPSFTKPVRGSGIVTRTDGSHGMVRTEVRSASSDAHLGHVFDDGPEPGGTRYCINSAALRFVPEEECTAYFAAGCFWGTEAYFRLVPGVLETAVGYMGGFAVDPTYEKVCAGSTGHAETVRVIFDPERVSYRDLLEHFFRMHDPTTVNRQGNDVGTQYRSAVFYVSERQRLAVDGLIREMTDSGRYSGPIVTEISAAGAFTVAEEYHQRYLERNPGGYCHVNLDLARRPLG